MSRDLLRRVGLPCGLLVAGAAVAAGGHLAWRAGWAGRTLEASTGGLVITAGALPLIEVLLAWHGRRQAAWRWVVRVGLSASVLLVACVASVVLGVMARNASSRVSEERGRIVIEALERSRARTGAYPATLEGLLTADGKPLPVPSIDRHGWNYRLDGEGFCLGFSPGWIDWVWWCSERGRWERT